MLFIVSIIIFLITGVIFYAGTYTPLDVKIIYYFEILSKNFYVTFISSILILGVSIKLMLLNKYQLTELEIFDDRIAFNKQSEKIELMNDKIHKLYWRNKLFGNKIQLTIKTIGLKKYRVRIDIMNYSRLKKYIPDSKFEYNELSKYHI